MGKAFTTTWGARRSRPAIQVLVLAVVAAVMLPGLLAQAVFGLGHQHRHNHRPTFSTMSARAAVEDCLYAKYLQPNGFTERHQSNPDHAFNPTTGQNAVWEADKLQWIDPKTGQPLSPARPTANAVAEDCLYAKYVQPQGFTERHQSNPDHAFNPNTGQNAVWEADKLQWIDPKTLEPLSPPFLPPSVPPSGTGSGNGQAACNATPNPAQLAVTGTALTGRFAGSVVCTGLPPGTFFDVSRVGAGCSGGIDINGAAPPIALGADLFGRLTFSVAGAGCVPGPVVIAVTGPSPFTPELNVVFNLRF
jgi:hypothetical protein